MKMKFKDAPFATLLTVEERMSDGRGVDEMRYTYYTRREGEPHLDKFLPAHAIGIVQGCLWRLT